MKIIYNKIIPFKGFLAINLFGALFVRGEKGQYLSEKVINHESIHTEQIKECLYIGFYILYLLFWFERLVWNARKAYRGNPFEQEAYSNQSDLDYIPNRKRYAWLKYCFKKV